MICLYHSVDLDGACSAAIVKWLHPECELVGVDYHQKIDWKLFDSHAVVFVVDFSYPMSDMQKLEKRSRLTWCDHHITSIEAAEEVGFNPPGFRDVDRAGCQLVWDWFFSLGELQIEDNPTGKYPRGVVLLADYNLTKVNPVVLGFEYGLRRFGYDPCHPIWTHIFLDDMQCVNNLIGSGQIIMRYVQAEAKRFLDQYGWVAWFAGYKTLFLNHIQFPRLLLNPLDMEEYSGCALFVYYHQLLDRRFRVLVNSSRKDIHCGKLCHNLLLSERALSGGGHQFMGGLVCKDFMKLVSF